MSAARNSCVNPTLPNLKKIERMGRFDYKNNQSKGSVELDTVVRNHVVAPSETEIDFKKLVGQGSSTELRQRRQSLELRSE